MPARFSPRQRVAVAQLATLELRMREEMRFERLERNQSVRDWAHAVGVSQAYCYGLENGYRRWDTRCLFKVARTTDRLPSWYLRRACNDFNTARVMSKNGVRLGLVMPPILTGSDRLFQIGLSEAIVDRRTSEGTSCASLAAEIGLSARWLRSLELSETYWQLRHLVAVAVALRWPVPAMMAAAEQAGVGLGGTGRSRSCAAAGH